MCQIGGHVVLTSDSLYGVPQGSILWPTLFSVYINNVALAAGDSLIHLYADDTIPHTSGPLDTVNKPFVTSRLDYCNALLSGYLDKALNKLQIVINTAARILARTKRFDHITPVLTSLQWIPGKG